MRSSTLSTTYERYWKNLRPNNAVESDVPTRMVDLPISQVGYTSLTLYRGWDGVWEMVCDAYPT